MINFWSPPEHLPQVLPRRHELEMQLLGHGTLPHVNRYRATHRIEWEVEALDAVIALHPNFFQPRFDPGPAERERLTRATRFEIELRCSPHTRPVSFYSPHDATIERVPLPKRPPHLDLDGIDRAMKPHHFRFYDPGLGTTMLGDNYEVMSTDQAIVIYLQGTSGIYSTDVSMLGAMDLLGKVEDDGKKQRVMAGIAPALPWHTFGPRDNRFCQKSYFILWLQHIIEAYRPYGLPIVLVGRSGGANPALEVAYLLGKQSGVAAVIAISPYGDHDAAWNAYYHEWRAHERPGTRRLGHAWETSLEGQYAFSMDDVHRLTVPAMIMFGAEDLGDTLPPHAADWYIQASHRLGAELVVSAGGHNPLDTRNASAAHAARDAIHDFLARYGILRIKNKTPANRSLTAGAYFT